MAAPTEAQAARVKQAILAKAVRFLSMPGTPFGVFGVGKDGVGFPVQRDFAIGELLFGLRYLDLDISTVEVDSEDVISEMGATSDDFNAERTEAVATAIASAKDWVATYLDGGAGIA